MEGNCGGNLKKDESVKIILFRKKNAKRIFLWSNISANRKNFFDCGSLFSHARKTDGIAIFGVGSAQSRRRNCITYRQNTGVFHQMG